MIYELFTPKMFIVINPTASTLACSAKHSRSEIAHNLMKTIDF